MNWVHANVRVGIAPVRRDTRPKPEQVEHNISKLAAYGPTYHDTVKFDDRQELKEFAESLCQCRIMKIRLWYGSLVPTLVVNGIQLTYKNLDTGKIFETKERFGNHQLHGYVDFYMNENELIHKASIRVGHVIDQVTFNTTHPQTISKGESAQTLQNFELEDNQVVVGTYGGFGGHLHNFGLYVSPVTEVRFWKRKSYLYMRAMLEKEKYKNVKEHAEEMYVKKSIPKGLWADYAFVLLVVLGDQYFVRVMRYI